MTPEERGKRQEARDKRQETSYKIKPADEVVFLNKVEILASV